jgi:hypothetical protein
VRDGCNELSICVHLGNVLAVLLFVVVLWIYQPTASDSQVSNEKSTDGLTEISSMELVVSLLLLSRLYFFVWLLKV